eukprot:COSAG02_NODE_25910_length_645_cov_2.785714_1_plen_141_part_10
MLAQCVRVYTDIRYTRCCMHHQSAARHCCSMMAQPPQLPSPGLRPRVSVAPMMAWTDHHFRQMARMMSARVLLYTEMYPVEQVLLAARRGEAELRSLLAFDPVQRPLAVQLGGSDPTTMGEAAALCARMGYDEVNINVGCP